MLGAKPAGKGIRGIFAKMRDRLSRSKEMEERELRKEAAEAPSKEPIKVDVIPAPEHSPTTVLNGAKSTRELHLHNGEKPAPEPSAPQIGDKNPLKEPHS